jgi:putative flippase GtrA
MIVRYFFVGGAAALVDWSLFYIFAQLLGLSWFAVALASFTAATLVNYVLSVRHVFRSGTRFSAKHELTMVFAVSAAGLAINQAILGLLIERAHWYMMLAKITATGIVFIWNYAFRRFYIFRPGTLA